jgi:hypothetical protein
LQYRIKALKDNHNDSSWEYSGIIGLTDEPLSGDAPPSGKTQEDGYRILRSPSGQQYDDCWSDSLSNVCGSRQAALHAAKQQASGELDYALQKLSQGYSDLEFIHILYYCSSLVSLMNRA